MPPRGGGATTASRGYDASLSSWLSTPHHILCERAAAAAAGYNVTGERCPNQPASRDCQHVRPHEYEFLIVQLQADCIVFIGVPFCFLLLFYLFISPSPAPRQLRDFNLGAIKWRGRRARHVCRLRVILSDVKHASGRAPRGRGAARRAAPA